MRVENSSAFWRSASAAFFRSDISEEVPMTSRTLPFASRVNGVFRPPNHRHVPSGWRSRYSISTNSPSAERASCSKCAGIRRRSSGCIMRGMNDAPIARTSSTEYPITGATCALIHVIRRSMISIVYTTLGVTVVTRWRKCERSRRASSARLMSVMSRPSGTSSTTLPCSSRMGVMLKSTSTSAPSFIRDFVSNLTNSPAAARRVPSRTCSCTSGK